MKRSKRAHNRGPEPERKPPPASIAAAWQSYDRMVLPPGAGDVQRNETRIAFYAGAATVFFGVLRNLDEGDEPTAADVARMDAVYDELQRFSETFNAEFEQRRQDSAAVKEALAAVEEISRQVADGEHQLGDAPIEAAYADKMAALCAVADQFLNGQVGGEGRKHGFVMLCFPFDDSGAGRCNFVSNGADRRDIVVLFREMIARMEGMAEASGHA